MKTTAIILAAGNGTRMKSARTKVMHEILGHPLVWWAVRSARLSGADQIICVVGNGSEEVRALFANDTDVTCIEQTERLGTGHAVKTVLDQVSLDEGVCVILNGDSPLVKPETITALTEKVSSESMGAAVLTMTPPCVDGYGRIVIDDEGHVMEIIEHKDCTDDQRIALTECNSGVYAFNSKDLTDYINQITCENAQGEYYLTDMIAILKNHGKSVAHVHADDFTELLGVNSRIQLAEAAKIMQLRINHALMEQGVTMLDPNLVWADVDVKVGRDTTILPMVFLNGNTTIGERCTIGPNSRLTDTTVANDCVIDETITVEAIIDDKVTCGPRAYLRPGTHMCEASKAGTHVEIKKSTIGTGSKVPHLSYIGDTTMGENVNIGAGAITCNYDGTNKHKTNIGDNVFVGSDVMMVAPVNIGSGAIVGAASCITKDIPADALGLERSEQNIIDGYASKRRKASNSGKGTRND